MIGPPMKHRPKRRPFVSRPGYDDYVQHRATARGHLGLPKTIQALDTARQNFWKGLARRADSLFTHFLAGGLEGAFVTIRRRSPRKGGPSKVRPAMDDLRAIIERWKRAMRGKGIRVTWVFWVAEPWPQGHPHVHAVALVPAGQVKDAVDALLASYHPRLRGKSPRRTTKQEVFAGRAVTGQDLLERNNFLGIPEFLYYLLKMRLQRSWEFTGTRHGGVLDVEAWCHANGLSATCSRVPPNLGTFTAQRQNLGAGRGAGTVGQNTQKIFPLGKRTATPPTPVTLPGGGSAPAGPPSAPTTGGATPPGQPAPSTAGPAAGRGRVPSGGVP